MSMEINRRKTRKVVVKDVAIGNAQLPGCADQQIRIREIRQVHIAGDCLFSNLLRIKPALLNLLRDVGLGHGVGQRCRFGWRS